MAKTPYKRPSLYSALRTLERFFAASSSDSVTKEEMFASWQRDKPQLEGRNDKWLYNKLTAVYFYNLAQPNYTHDPYRRLVSIELTDRGKRALGRTNHDVTEQQKEQTTTYGRGSEGIPNIEDLISAAERINLRLTSYRVRISIDPTDRT